MLSYRPHHIVVPEHYKRIIIRKDNNIYMLVGRITNLSSSWKGNNLKIVKRVKLNGEYDLDDIYEEEFFKELQEIRG